MFNYQNLESGQFEKLCRDIMQVKTGKQLHVFASGRDGGVDLTDDSDKHNIVVQVKHYEKSSFTALKNNLEKEVDKVKKLNPKQYYICVSQNLTNSNIKTIYQMFSDHMESANNILALDDIDSFLHDPENIQITRNHTNLWLESGTTLQLLLECFPNVQTYLVDKNLLIDERQMKKKESIEKILYFLEGKRLLVNPAEMERKKWCIESACRIKQLLEEQFEQKCYSDSDFLHFRLMIDACNTFLDRLDTVNEEGIIYKNKNGDWEDYIFSYAMKSFRKEFKSNIDWFVNEYEVTFKKSIP